MEEELDIIVNPIDPVSFELQNYSPADEKLIASSNLDTSFSDDTDYIEFYIYDQNGNFIYPRDTIQLRDYTVRDGDVLLNPSDNLSNLGFDIGTFNIVYNFYRKRLSSDSFNQYFISEISSDRKEIRLDSNIIENGEIIASTEDFIQYRDDAPYFVDFYLNFGENNTIIANNIRLEQDETDDPTILIKLYEPLPGDIDVKAELWVGEVISTPQAYQVTFPVDEQVEDDFTYLQGPNYSLEVRQETATSGQAFSFDALLSSNVTSSINQIKSLLNEKDINININYENYGNFVNMSSAKSRLENFSYKVGLIQSCSNQISSFLETVDQTSNTVDTKFYSSSQAVLTSQINEIIENFDGYEYFLYFNSGSLYSWPKETTTPPYVLANSGSAKAKTWLGSTDPSSAYFGGQLTSASNYDDNNPDYLLYAIPEYLREDVQNAGYELFVDMVGQYYDNVWLYTKDIANKFNADNRLDYGISKDLVADAIKDFGLKLYANNFNTDDLFTAFLGLTPSGSTFPVTNITGSISGSLGVTGYEYITAEVSASNDIVSLNDTQKQVYKRIYHNIPYLLKTKGTIATIRALITSYGIPDTILRVSEFGSKDRNESQDYDLKQDVFNYMMDTRPDANSCLTSSFNLSTNFGGGTVGGNGNIHSLQLRFKPASIPTASANVASSDIRYSQSLWVSKKGSDITGSLLVLEYTGSGFTSGSYSGSVPNAYDNYGTLKWIPAAQLNPALSASIYLPFFNGDWWSAQINFTDETSTGALVTSSLFAANQINGKVGWTGSDTVLGHNTQDWNRSINAFLNTSSNLIHSGKTYQPFSGSYQEYRFWNQQISESNFHDYTVNPFSNEGNGVNSTPNQLAFRADLGTQIDTGSNTSIHPRITGSAVQITASFKDGNSDFKIENPTFKVNVEDIFQDQVPAGIKNRITNKIQIEKHLIAEEPYGFQTPTSSMATTASSDNTTLSGLRSIETISFQSQSYTPSVNYLEVGFSPSNQINDDINAQIGYFNLGDYIGDPREVSSSSYTYPTLDILRDAYFEKYIKGYDVTDFIRLIKFFDNSLFKMIKDYIPARTSLASGVVIKQHLLERNRQRPAQVTSSFQQYSGSVKPFPKDYNTGSSDQPQYATSGSAIYKFTGGPGGSFNRYNGLQSYYYTFSNLSGSINVLNFNDLATNNMVGVDSDDNDAFPANLVTNCCGTFPIEVGSFTGAEGYPLTSNFSILIQQSSTPGYQSGSVGQFPNYQVGDFISIAATDIGGDSGFFTSFITQRMLITTMSSTPTNQFFLTQSWSESVDNSVLNSTYFNQSSSQWISGSFKGGKHYPYSNYLHSDQSEFYNGIFSGSNLIVTTQSLNSMCDAYLNISDTPVQYYPIFFSFTDTLQSTITRDTFFDVTNVPPAGYAWIASEQTDDPISGIQQVVAIKFSDFDVNGNEVVNYLDDFADLRILFSDSNLPYSSSAAKYIITGRTIYADHAICNVSLDEGNNIYETVAGVTYYPITSSQDGGSMNWSFQGATKAKTGAGISQSSDLLQLNTFTNYTTTGQQQVVFVFDGDDDGTAGAFVDPLGFSNTGSKGIKTDVILSSGSEYFNNAAFVPSYTPNIPLFFSASLIYSSSYCPSCSTNITALGIYHSGSSYEGGGLTDQNFEIGTGGVNAASGFYINDNSGAGFSSAAAAAAASTPSEASHDTIIYFDNGGNSAAQITNGDSIYSNTSLSTEASLTTTKYYKASNGDATEWITFQAIINLLTGTTVTNVAWASPNGSGTKVAAAGFTQTLAGGATKFQPSPRTIDLVSTEVFYTPYDTQIPGGAGVASGSLGGHPKLRAGGTASLDFRFPTLTLDGTPPTLLPPVVEMRPLSGSTTNSNNTGYSASFSSFGGAFGYTGSSLTSNSDNGGYLINWGQAATTVAIDTAQTVTDIIQFHVVSSYEVRSENSNENFTASIWRQTLDAGDGSVKALGQLPGTEINASSGIASLSSFSLVSFTSSVSPDTDTRDFLFLRIEAPNNFKYYINQFQHSVTMDYYGSDSINYQNYNFFTPFSTAAGYQGSSTVLQQYTSSTVSSGDRYNQAQVDIYLKVTGSYGERIITSSIYDSTTRPNEGFSGSIYPGVEMSFAGSPLLGINNTAITTSNTQSTINHPDDMYFIEYSMSNFVGGVINGVAQTSQEIEFVTSNNDASLVITQSANINSGTEYNVTGSVRILKSNRSDIVDNGDFDAGIYTTPGEVIVNMPFVIPTSSAATRVTVSGSYAGGFLPNDCFRFAVGRAAANVGSGFVVKNITCSFSPSQSIWAPLATPSALNNYDVPAVTDFIVPTFYGAGVLPFNLADDCQPLINNYNLQRQNSYLMDVDYNNESGPIIPVNQAQILANTAIKAAIPDSNYTMKSCIIPRYLGSKSTSKYLNQWSVGDIGTFGKNPTIELRDAFFGYFNDLDDPYPNINGVTRVNLNYLIDEQGNALPPSLDRLSIDTFESVFPSTTTAKLAVKSGKQAYQPLGNPAVISRLMKFVTPIMYSQNSSNNYTNLIPLSGSGYISRYDNSDEQSQVFGQFMAAGEASIDSTGVLQEVDYWLNPTTVSYGSGSTVSTYSGSNGTPTGSVFYATTPWGTLGSDLANQQIINLETSVVTSYVSETRGTRDELRFNLYCYTGSGDDTQIGFNLISIDAKVYTDTGTVTLIKNVDEYGWFDWEDASRGNANIVPNANPTSVSQWLYSRVRNNKSDTIDGIQWSIDWEMRRTLFDLGITRTAELRSSQNIIGIEWIIKANTGNYTIKVGDKIRWRLAGRFKNASSGFQQGYFFPSTYDGAQTSVKIQGQGAYDWMLENANKAEAPYWVYTGSAGGYSSVISQSVLVMSSSNMNEAYGNGFQQGIVEYFPGPSEYFPGGVEPEGTNFEQIYLPLELQEGDEIRFGNNESFTYKILEVFAPQENIEKSSTYTSGKARLKIRVDGQIPTSVNKDFFLVRRPVVNPNSLYLETPFPYGALASASISKRIVSGSDQFALTGSASDFTGSGDTYTGSFSSIELATTPGILYPDYPTEYLINSASTIVNNLISKGIIES